MSEPHLSLLIIGSEITEGRIRDSHGYYLAGKLREIGIEVHRIVQVPDSIDASAELEQLTKDSSGVIISGGLGPTSDDITREIITRVAGAELVFNSDIWRDIQKMFQKQAAGTNKRQAYIPDGFEAVPNYHGTAPGLSGEIHGCRVYALPGPPRELKPMFEQSILPKLKSWIGDVSETDEITTGTAFLIQESRLEEFLQSCSSPGIQWGTRAEESRVVFTLKGGTVTDRLKVIDDLRAMAGSACIRPEEVDAAQCLNAILRQKALTVAGAESCTGGMVAAMITQVAGSSDCFWGCMVSYANDAKMEVLGVNSDTIEQFGAVSEECVREMVSGILRISEADVVYAVSGIAGPGGGRPGKPVGTVWIGVGKPDSLFVHRFLFNGNRERIRMKAAVAALILCEKMAIDSTSLDTAFTWEYI